MEPQSEWSLYWKQRQQILMRMRGEGDTSIAVMRMWINPATVQIGVEVPQQDCYRTTIGPRRAAAKNAKTVYQRNACTSTCVPSVFTIASRGSSLLTCYQTNCKCGTYTQENLFSSTGRWNCDICWKTGKNRGSFFKLSSLIKETFLCNRLRLC